jgi:hypothetical protein
MENAPHLTEGCHPELQRCINNTSPGMAAWSGWKALHETCGDCVFFDRGKEWKAEGVCLKAREMLRAHKRGNGKPPKIRASTRACRYWEGR